MEHIEKRVRSGLKKCPLHRFGALYKHFYEGWVECEKCHGYHELPQEVFKSLGNEVKIKKGLRSIHYELT